MTTQHTTPAWTQHHRQPPVLPLKTQPKSRIMTPCRKEPRTISISCCCYHPSTPPNEHHSILPPTAPTAPAQASIMSISRCCYHPQHHPAKHHEHQTRHFQPKTPLQPCIMNRTAPGKHHAAAVPNQSATPAEHHEHQRRQASPNGLPQASIMSISSGSYRP